jgi:uncharacterized paraquat-inducible protein A
MKKKVGFHLQQLYLINWCFFPYVYMIRANVIIVLTVLRKMMNTNEQYLSGPLLWIGISLGVIFAIYFYTPFPLSIPLAITAFIFLNFYLRKKVVKKMNTIGNTTGSSNASSLIYSCINCGTRHNETACPKCGSKMKKADFHRF